MAPRILRRARRGDAAARHCVQGRDRPRPRAAGARRAGRRRVGEGTTSEDERVHDERGRVVGVVLAAGAATRFGGPKQRLFLPRVLALLREAPVDEIVVAAGAYNVEAVGARVVECADWERGPGASLRCALASLAPDVDAVVVALADGPNLAPEAVRRVLARWRDGGAHAVAASYGGERGHPVVLDRRAWTLVPDEGARAIPAALVPCDDLGSPGDVDTPADLAAAGGPDGPV